VDFWKVRPEALALLNRATVRDLMDPPPLVLPPTSTLDDVGRAFADSDSDVLLIGDEHRKLEGLVTMTDLARAGSAGADPRTAVTQLMTRHPVTLGIDDNAAVAATVLREHSLKHVPIVDSGQHRRVVGLLRARRLIAHVYANRDVAKAA
jgi:CBS domain-containing protein